MKELKRSAGFYLSLIGAVLNLAGTILYGGAIYKNIAVYVLLIISVVIEAALVLASYIKGIRPEYNIAVMVNTVLAMTAAGISVLPMVREIGNAIAGLNKMSVIYPYYRFLAAVLLGWFLFLISSYKGVSKEVE